MTKLTLQIGETEEENWISVMQPTLALHPSPGLWGPSTQPGLSWCLGV